MPVKLLILLLTVLSLSACDMFSSNPSTSTTDNGTTADLSGRAVKGVLKHATITAYARENGMLRYLSETTTDDQGDFSLKVTGVKGPVVIEATPAGDGSTTMTCDAVSGCGNVPFGSDVPVAKDFRLDTVLGRSDLTGGKSVAITPLTHLAASWVENMPGNVSQPEIDMARNYVAQVAEVTPDFAFRRPLDVTNANEMKNADVADIGTAVMGAAFQEAASSAREDFVASLATQFADQGGQLVEKGTTTSLNTLLQSAVKTANGIGVHLPVLQQMAASMQFRSEHLADQITDVHPQLGGAGTQAFATAKSVLVDLGSELDDAGMDGSGKFATLMRDRLSWMDQQQVAALADLTHQMYGGAAFLALFSEVIYQRYGITSQDISPAPSEYSEVVDFVNQTLTIKGTYDEQQVDLTLGLPAVRKALSAEQPLTFSLKGTVASSAVDVDVNASLTFDPLDTDMTPVVTALNDMMSDSDPNTGVQPVMDAVNTVEQQLHSKITIDGQVGFTPTDVTKQPAQTDMRVVVESDMRNTSFIGKPDMNITVDRVHITGAQGQDITAVVDQPALSLSLGDNAVLTTAMDFRQFNVSQVQVDSKMSVGMSSSGQLEESGTMLLNLVARNKQYTVTYKNDALTISKANSMDPAVRIVVQGFGGLLYAGNQLIGTMAMDSDQHGFHIALADGSLLRHRFGDDASLATIPVFGYLLTEGLPSFMTN